MATGNPKFSDKFSSLVVDNSKLVTGVVTVMAVAASANLVLSIIDWRGKSLAIKKAEGKEITEEEENAILLSTGQTVIRLVGSGLMAIGAVGLFGFAVIGGKKAFTKIMNKAQGKASTTSF